MEGSDARPKLKAKSPKPKTSYRKPATSLPNNPFVMPLHRSVHNYMIGGVCGGIAEWLGWNPTLVRISYVVVSILSAAFPGLLVYIILWMVMPRADY